MLVRALFRGPSPIRALVALTAALVLGPPAFAQCDPTVPTFLVDLSYSPTATFLSPAVQRLDNCCGTTAPDQCVQFILTLHPLAQGIVFNICSGAIPGGAMFYQVACGPSSAVGEALCLNGPGPHIITFCKPGNNINEYCIVSLPIPAAGPDIAVNDGCSGTISSSGFDPTTTLWTSVAPGAPGAYDGYLTCPTCTTTTVVPSGAFPPFVDYVICGAAVGACGNTPTCDTTRVYFNSTLTATIAPLQPTVCFGAVGTTITALGGGGTPPYSYLWNTGATSASIYVGVGTYTVQVSDTSGCPPTTASVLVTEFLQPIEALAGGDILVCGNVLPVQLNGTVTGASGGQWTTGGGQYQPSVSALNATYMPTPAELLAGSVELILATTGNGTCPGDQDTVLVTFANSFQGLTIASTDVTCAGGSDGTATVLPNSPAFTYAWDDPAAQTTHSATALGAGMYSVTITDAFGCDTTLTTTVGGPAAITIANVQVVDESCAGLGDGQVTVSASGGTPPYQYAWSNGGNTSSITVGAGTYNVVITDANGCAPASATAVVNALAQPNVANAGPDLIGCMDELPLDLLGSVQNATGGQWSGGAGIWTGTGLNVQYTPTLSEIQSGTLLLFLTTTGNTNCAADADSVLVQLSNSFLNGQVTSTPVDCYGSATGSATFLPNTPGLSYLWSDPNVQTTNPAVGLSAGNYQVTVTDQLGCDTTMSVAIAQPTPLQLTLTQSADPICANSTNGWATVQASGGTPGYTYQWNAAANNQLGPTASGLPGGTFGVTATDANGCQVQLSTTLNPPPVIMLSAHVPDTVCVNAPTLLSAQAAGGTGNLLISWSGIGTGTSITHSFATNQTVVVTVVDASGCNGPVLTFPVTVLDLPSAQLITAGNTTVCPGDTATVSAQVQGYPANVQLWWPQLGQFGTGPFQVPVNANMTLDVIATDVCGNTLSQVVLLNIDQPPAVLLPPVFAEGCAPLTVQFPDTIVDGTLTYLWTFGDGATSVSEAPIHTFQAGTWNVGLTVTTALGCPSSASAPGLVIAHAPPTAAFTASTWMTDVDHAQIAFTDESSGALAGHAWDFGDGGTSDQQHPDHTYIDVDQYQVMLIVTDIRGCVDTAVHVVNILPVYDIVIPNIFTPGSEGGNGGWYDPNDLSNDVFYPFVKYIDDFNMRIFNRWGELIFESTDLFVGWDGYYRGQLSPQDVYVYTMRFGFIDGYVVDRIGDVTLAR